MNFPQFRAIRILQEIFFGSKSSVSGIGIGTTSAQVYETATATYLEDGGHAERRTLVCLDCAFYLQKSGYKDVGVGNARKLCE